MILAKQIRQHAPRLGRSLSKAAIRTAFGLVIGHSSTALAAVADVGPGGFTVHETAEIAAPPDKVFAAIIAPKNWWNGEHSFSGSAANFTLDARAGGCWCETLPDGGSVLHLTVVDVQPGKKLVMRGALGPFQGMAVEGAFTWTLTPSATGTTATLDYALGGYIPKGFAGPSQGVDAVLGEQIARMKSFVETGSPDAAKPH
jgi:uncharacterized protein YndB with AHSA1/START domain